MDLSSCLLGSNKVSSFVVVSSGIFDLFTTFVWSFNVVENAWFEPIFKDMMISKYFIYDKNH